MFNSDLKICTDLENMLNQPKKYVQLIDPKKVLNWPKNMIQPKNVFEPKPLKYVEPALKICSTDLKILLYQPNRLTIYVEPT